MTGWRQIITSKDSYVMQIDIKALIMKDQYEAVIEYAKQLCNGDLNLAFQKCLFFGINNTLEKFAQTKSI